MGNVILDWYSSEIVTQKVFDDIKPTVLNVTNSTTVVVYSSISQTFFFNRRKTVLSRKCKPTCPIWTNENEIKPRLERHRNDN